MCITGSDSRHKRDLADAEVGAGDKTYAIGTVQIVNYGKVEPIVVKPDIETNNSTPSPLSKLGSLFDARRVPRLRCFAFSSCADMMMVAIS